MMSNNNYKIVDDNNDGLNENISTISRRSFVFLSAFIGGTSITASTNDHAYARDELFKPNPLTNPLLEQIRIWEQAEADNIRYDGELEAGNAGNRGKVDAYPKLLVPILQMNDELKVVNGLISASTTTDDSNELQSAYKILQQNKYDKIPFKRTFNAFADNIYYGDPDRANLYLGGGATPKTEQSLAYLQRNEILTNIEDLRAELQYLTKDEVPLEEKQDKKDLIKYSSNVIQGFEKYLDLVPPNEMRRAQEILSSI